LPNQENSDGNLSAISFITAEGKANANPRAGIKPIEKPENELEVSYFHLAKNRNVITLYNHIIIYLLTNRFRLCASCKKVSIH
jgi:hypothetical protein